MFGFRADGRRIAGIDPIVMLTPYIMPSRVDAQVHIKVNFDFDHMSKYIRAQQELGHHITHMGMLIAAYVRTLCQFPDLNRFIVNKQLYARNHVCVSFVTLKKNGNDEVEESLVKVEFDLNDTIYQVMEKLEAVIEKSRQPKDVNKTDRVARTLLAIPFLPNIVVGIVRLLDRYGFMPPLFHKASPFHTSLFISNMASIGMNYIYHHIYNFGTTSVFVAMGKTEMEVRVNSEGRWRSRRIMPAGVVVDERICSGGVYARAFAYLRGVLVRPELLEVPPETIKTEIDMKRAAKTSQINA